MTFELPKLNYDYNALEPYLSEELVRIHYFNHHQAYIDKLNSTIEDVPECKGKTVEYLISNLDSFPESKRTAIKNFGGGHFNHSMYWECLAPKSATKPSEKLLAAIDKKYGSFEDFVDEFSKVAISLFGSGWAWLMPDLSIQTTSNQDNPMNDGHSKPILCLDVWEHAYYVDYTYKRADYVKAWFSIVDWDNISKRFVKND